MIFLAFLGDPDLLLGVLDGVASTRLALGGWQMAAATYSAREYDDCRVLYRQQIPAVLSRWRIQRKQSILSPLLATIAHFDSLDGWFEGWRSRDESQTHGHALDDAGGVDQPASAGRNREKSVCRWCRDRYEAAKWLTMRRWLEANPDDELAKEVRAKLTSEPERYAAYTREYLGWGVFALMPR